MKELGEVIKTLRINRKLSQSAVADRVPGYDAGNLSRFERGSQDIKIDKLKAICDILNVQVSDVFKQTEAPEKNPSYQSNSDTYQITIKDLHQTVDKNPERAARIQELLSYLAALPEEYEKNVIQVASLIYDSYTAMDNAKQKVEILPPAIPRPKHMIAEQPRNDKRIKRVKKDIKNNGI